MRVAIPSLYAEYGRYCNQFRSIVWHVDCLKPVERRLLLTLHREAKTKFTKAAKVVGAAIALHPHGDASTYGTLVGLVNRGFADGQGNFGMQKFEEDGKAAAFRYTEVKSSNYIEDMAFKYIKFVPWETLEIEDEPMFLPCPVPLGLVEAGRFSTITQGISFETTKMPRYSFGDLITRLHEILVNGKGKTTIRPSCFKNNIAEAEPGEFERLLTTGLGQLWYCPEFTTHSKYIDIHSRNPNTGFMQLKKLFEKFPKNVAIEDLTSKCMQVRVHCKLGHVTSQFTKTVVEAISSKIHFKCNVVDDKGKVEVHSIDELLVRSYNCWVEAWRAKLNNDMVGLNNKLQRLHIIQIIRECFNPNTQSVDQIIAVFKQEQLKGNYSGYDEYDIRETASKGSIKQLIETKLDISTVQQNIKTLTTRLSNLDSEAVQYVGSLK